MIITDSSLADIRVLLLEDSPEDIELMKRELRRKGIRSECHVAETREAFLDEMKNFRPEIILSDHSMPRFSSNEALTLSRQLNFTGPFILVTGTVSEEFAVSIIKQGADDYILKSNLTRLVPAMQHALRSRKTEKDKEIAVERLRTSEERIRHFANHLNQVMEDERAHIAREIHDELGQQLTGIKFAVSGLRSNPQPELIDKVVSDIDQAMQSMRKIATQLRPGILDSLGLIPSLQWLAGEFEKKSGITCIFTVRGEERDFDRKVATAVFRICQESLTNIFKHANAQKALLVVDDDGQMLKVEIIDNGNGIMEGKLDNPFSMGLLGMKERANSIGAFLEISSAKEEGTKVSLIVNKRSHEKNTYH